MSLPTSKMYYSISEVCKETGLEQHVLRYWETEFANLKPKKNRAGNRAYRKKEIELVKYIKYLLYDKKYTIQGAKKVLSAQRTPDEKTDTEQGQLTVKKDRLTEIRQDLVRINEDINAFTKRLKA